MNCAIFFFFKIKIFFIFIKAIIAHYILLEIKYKSMVIYNMKINNNCLKKRGIIILLKENERIDDLEYKGLKIIQNKNGFCFGIDSVLLSDFAKEIKKDSRVLDLGN